MGGRDGGGRRPAGLVLNADGPHRQTAVFHQGRQGERAVLLVEVAREGFPRGGLGGLDVIRRSICLGGGRLWHDVVRAHGTAVRREVRFGHGRVGRGHLLVAMRDHGRDVVHHVAVGDVLSRLSLLEGQALVGRVPGRADSDGGRVRAFLAYRRDGLGPHGGSGRDAHHVVLEAACSAQRPLGGRLARLLTDHAAAELRIIPSEKLVAERAGVGTAGYLTEAPPVELAGEAGVLVHALEGLASDYQGASLAAAASQGGLGVEAVGSLGGEVERQDAGGEHVGTQDDEGTAVGKPRDDVADGGV
mmetsp:Transcript_11961/g.29250  ORF Transcript_11961/g.29250 Transcript_11961/m.29250 type:complete len:303 (-) Transcript_11961:860-1768(-)